LLNVNGINPFAISELVSCPAAVTHGRQSKRARRKINSLWIVARPHAKKCEKPC
jgi:hypothetical protein